MSSSRHTFPSLTAVFSSPRRIRQCRTR
jgi:hypothetical protein